MYVFRSRVRLKHACRVTAKVEVEKVAVGVQRSIRAGARRSVKG